MRETRAVGCVPVVGRRRCRWLRRRSLGCVRWNNRPALKDSPIDPYKNPVVMRAARCVGILCRTDQAVQGSRVGKALGDVYFSGFAGSRWFRRTLPRRTHNTLRCCVPTDRLTLGLSPYSLIYPQKYSILQSRSLSFSCSQSLNTLALNLDNTPCLVLPLVSRGPS